MISLTKKTLMTLLALGAFVGSATSANATCFGDCRSACVAAYPGDEEAQQDCLEACLIANHCPGH